MKRSLAFAIINFFSFRVLSSVRKLNLWSYRRVQIFVTIHLFALRREPQRSNKIHCVLYESSSPVDCRHGLGCLASRHFPRELRRAHLRVWSLDDLRSGTHLYQQLFLTGRSGNLQLTFAQRIFHSRTLMNLPVCKSEEIKYLIAII